MECLTWSLVPQTVYYLLIPQVVSGVNYKFVVEMGQTACRKTGVESNCPVRGDEAAAKVKKPLVLQSCILTYVYVLSRSLSKC